jgi:hypothetical protein
MSEFPTIQEVVEAIEVGAFDPSELSRITFAIAQANQESAMFAQVGDIVVSSSTVRPLYLRGAIGEIVGKSGAKVRVKWDPYLSHPRVAGRTWNMTAGSFVAATDRQIAARNQRMGVWS